MSWHYQIRKRVDKDQEWYDIVEVFDDPIGWSANSESPTGETPDEVVRTLQMMLDDAKKYPVLEDKE